MTLQDAGILGDLTKVLLPLSCASLVVAGLGAMAAALLTALSSPPFTEILLSLSFVLLFLLLVNYGTAPAVRFLRWAGAYQLTNPRKALRRANRILWWVRKPPFFGSGMTVLRSSEKSWRKLVRFLMRRAECVLIDLTVSSEPLLWEVATALSILGPRKIIIFYQQAEGSDVRPEIESGLAASFGAELHGFNWFGYPAQPPMSEQSPMLVRSPAFSRSQIKKKAKELRSIVRRCIQVPAEPTVGRSWLPGKSHEGTGSPEAATVPKDGEVEVLCGRCDSGPDRNQLLPFWGSRGCSARIVHRCCGSLWCSGLSSCTA